MKDLPSITVIGTGAVGSALIDYFEKKGFTLRSLWNQSGGQIWDEAAQKYKPSRSDFPSKSDELGDWIFITTPDGVIGSTAQKLSEKPISWGQKSMIHCSGNMTSAECEPLARKGARTASMHPLQTFQKGDGAERYKDIYISLEGEEGLVEELQSVIETMGAKPVRVTPGQKHKLHIAAVFASNYLVALMAAAEQILEEEGIDEGLRLLEPLIHQTLANILEHGAGQSITGPVARGDTATVRQHLTSLKMDTQKTELYTVLGKKALQIAQEKGNLADQDLHILQALFEEK